MYFLPKKLDDYIVEHSETEPELLQQLTRETYQKVLQPIILMVAKHRINQIYRRADGGNLGDFTNSQFERNLFNKKDNKTKERIAEYMSKKKEKKRKEKKN